MTALLTVWTLASAFAITEPQTGGRVELGAGLGLSGGPVQPAFGGHLHLALFRGQFDKAFSIGQYWEAGVTGRVDTRFDGTARIAPMVELRRGTDVVVASASPFLAGGPLVVTGPDAAVGWTARGGLATTYRAHRFRGLVLRLEAGADVVQGRATFAGGVILGLSLGRPFRDLSDAPGE